MSRYGKEVNKCLKKVQKGDKTQMGQLFELTANHLRGVAFMYLSDKSYCDDVVSDAYCKVMQYIDSFDPKQDGYNWLCKITERTAYEYNDIVNEDRNHTVNLDEAFGVGVEDKVADAKIEIFTAMEKLPAADRQILYDYFYLRMTYDEIAAKNGMAKSAVYKKAKKSFEILKKYLKNGEQNAEKIAIHNVDKRKE